MLAMRPFAWFSALLLSILIPGSAAASTSADAYRIRVTQLDTSAFPQLRIYVSVTDPLGRPISKQHRVKLAVFNGDQEIGSEPLSEGWKLSSVLIMDRSGSMAKKIDQAKKSARDYVEGAPEGYEMAVLAFSDSIPQTQGFTADKRLLMEQINQINTGGETALQDALGAALDLLAGRNGRKSIVLLTDGIENASRRYRGEEGLTALLHRRHQEEVTVSVIGLGEDVSESYLRRIAADGGRYFFAPEAGELQKVFAREAELLSTEYLLEVPSPFPNADGLRERLEVRLAVDDVPTRVETEYTAPGVLPHVRGRHAPFLVGAAILLLLPGAVTKARTLARVSQFRRRYLRRLRTGSAQLQQREVNSGDPLVAGDLVILCPSSNTPHFPRSWRLNRCRCMRDPQCGGAFCYQQVLPDWLRRLLDTLSGGQTDETGRRWLCHCRGDKEGY